VPEPGRRPSIANALELAAEHLQRAGVLNARREATALWAALAGVRPGDVWLGRGGEPDAPVVDKFWAAVERRASGVPFPYVVGHVAFRTLQLRCDPRALIPRPETEGLVGLVLEWARGEAGGLKGGVAADVGTGSGCIALALAVEGPFERVIAVERSPEAAALARENVALVRPPVPVEVRDGELLAPLAGARYRAIVSNPPYVTAAEYDALDPAARGAAERGGRSRDHPRPFRRRGRPARARRGVGSGDRRAARRRRACAGARARLGAHRHSRRFVWPAALRAGVPQGGRVIDEKAQELGRLLGQSEEYKALLRASQRLKEDVETQKLLEEVERLAEAIEGAAQQGKEPARESVERYDEILKTVQRSPVYQQMVAAQANFEKLMAKVNATIYEGMQKGAASPIITLG
jgi:release factor glutamine methyltransferase